MTTETATQMDGLEIADFLASQETGVLSLASDDDAYAIPVSYAISGNESNLFVRLGYGPGSEKRRFVEATEEAVLVVYDETDEGWRSVVARGPLEPLGETELDDAVETAVRGLDIPFFRVHDRPTDDLEFSLVRLRTTSLTGVVEAVGGRNRTAPSEA